MSVSRTKSLIDIVNMETEKRKFLFDQKYNPQFAYDEEVADEQLLRYGPVSGEYLPLAERILQTVVKKFGSEENFIAQEGAELNQEQTEKIIRKYLRELHFENRVSLVFSSQFIARTAIALDEKEFLIKIRLPIEYRENNLLPILNHEIGTHIFRWYNEENQPWFGKHAEYGFAGYLETEEGLAVLNYMSSHPAPYLWMPALYYFSAYHAQFLSFSDLAKKLQPYVSTAERRWKMCLRVKRGFTDTSEPGAYTKDQIYLTGAVKVSNWLQQNEYDVSPLYIGKISLEDVDRLTKLPEVLPPVTPAFTQEPEYKKKLKSIIALNSLTQV